MTWTLDNGTIVLQNFVNKDEAWELWVFICNLFLKDCTADKIDYWGNDYLDLVWNMTGTAECCYTDGCNDNREEKPTTLTTTTTDTTTATTSHEVTESSEDSQDKDIIEDEDIIFSVDCSPCENIQWSVCASDPGRKNIQNIGSVAIIRPQKSPCSCIPGFLPLYERQNLVKCVDPIIKTSSLMGR